MHALATPRRFALLLTALLLLAGLALLLALLMGSVSITLPGLWQDLFSRQPSISHSVLQLRLERGWLAFVTGGSLALSGALMQLLLRNPLADPTFSVSPVVLRWARCWRCCWRLPAG